MVLDLNFTQFGFILISCQGNLIRINNKKQMERQVPIIITTKANTKKHILFRVPTQNASEQNKSMQEQIKSPHFIDVQGQKRTRTVSKREKSAACTRARRISSSTAAKRFPKDFFRPQTSIQSVVQKHEKQENNRDSNMLDTFNQRSFPIRRQPQNKNITTCKSQFTPKFKFLKTKHNQIKKNLNSAQGNRRIQELPPLNQFFSLKDEVFQLDLSKKCAKNSPKRKQMKQITPEFSNFNVTLGQKINMALIFRKDKDRKKINKLRQKQNTFNLPLILNGVTLMRPEENYSKNEKI